MNPQYYWRHFNKILLYIKFAKHKPSTMLVSLFFCLDSQQLSHTCCSLVTSCGFLSEFKTKCPKGQRIYKWINHCTLSMHENDQEKFLKILLQRKRFFNKLYCINNFSETVSPLLLYPCCLIAHQLKEHPA